MIHIIDTLATEHETLAKITAHLANGEDNQAKAELSEMVWRLAGIADSLQTQFICTVRSKSGALYDYYKGYEWHNLVPHDSPAPTSGYVKPEYIFSIKGCEINNLKNN